MESSPRDSAEFDIRSEKIKVESEKQHNTEYFEINIKTENRDDEIKNSEATRFNCDLCGHTAARKDNLKIHISLFALEV